jgi:polysaccharide pyruvyl transferase WcaK-like protein
VTYLLIGNYGVGNVGDEALREYFLQSFPEINWLVVSASPKEGELYRLPAGVRSFFAFKWVRTVHALIKSDGVVLGGGSLFTDIESPKACFLWWVHVYAAQIFRKKVLLAFQGIGPFRTKIGKAFARSAARSADYISVRDSASLQRVQSWKKMVEVTQSFDPVFSLIEKRAPNLEALHTLVLIPRENSGNTFCTRAKELARNTERWKRVSILSLRSSSKTEQQYCKRLEQELNIPCTISTVPSLSALGTAVSEGSFVLTERYHGAIAALALGLELEIITQGTQDKLDALKTLIQDTSAHGRSEKLLSLVRSGEQSLREML